MWISSSSVRNAICPARISARIASRPATIASRSASVSSPTVQSIRAWACDPRTSTSASRESKLIDSVNRSTRGSVCPSNRPPHALATIRPQSHNPHDTASKLTPQAPNLSPPPNVAEAVTLPPPPTKPPVAEAVTLPPPPTTKNLPINHSTPPFDLQPAQPPSPPCYNPPQIDGPPHDEGTQP